MHEIRVTPQETLPAPHRVRLEHNDVLLEVAPHVGGSISQLVVRGRPLLRELPLNSNNVLEASSFPLVPIINRIPAGRFSFEGHNVELQPNLPGSPDFLHGQGWRSSWSLTHQDAEHISLRFKHSRGEWPWTYVAQQHFSIIHEGLRVELSVHNTSSEKMPAGLGFHPYFLRTPQTRVKTQYDGYWEANEALHPQEKRAGSYQKDWCQGDLVVGDVLTDHTHYGFGGLAEIYEPNGPTIVMRANPACQNLHIYTPTEGPSFCLEPVTDRADPFNEEPRRIKILEPDESYSIWMEITARVA